MSKFIFAPCHHVRLTSLLLLLQVLSVSEMCSLNGEICRVPWTATPSMDLLSAQFSMNKYGMNQVPVVKEHVEDYRGHPVGLLDAECINLTCRFGYQFLTQSSHCQFFFFFLKRWIIFFFFICFMFCWPFLWWLQSSSSQRIPQLLFHIRNRVTNWGRRVCLA